MSTDTDAAPMIEKRFTITLEVHEAAALRRIIEDAIHRGYLTAADVAKATPTAGDVVEFVEISDETLGA